jgi:TRAP-type C4-dicarboxylate transport system permease large subunit
VADGVAACAVVGWIAGSAVADAAPTGSMLSLMGFMSGWNPATV